MKIKMAVIAATIGLSGTATQAGIIDSIKGFFYDCKSHCDEKHIDCQNTDAKKKGSLPYCKATCLGADKKPDELAAYQAAIDSCASQSVGTSSSSPPSH